jgi:hypothetical protein
MTSNIVSRVYVCRKCRKGWFRFFKRVLLGRDSSSIRQASIGIVEVHIVEVFDQMGTERQSSLKPLRRQNIVGIDCGLITDLSPRVLARPRLHDCCIDQMLSTYVASVVVYT